MERLQLMEKVETQLKQRRQEIDFYLGNSDKMPQEPKIANSETSQTELLTNQQS